MTCRQAADVLSETRRLKASFYFLLRKIIRGLERTRKYFFVLKSLVPTQSSQDKEKLSCPFQSTDNFPKWKLALMQTYLNMLQLLRPIYIHLSLCLPHSLYQRIDSLQNNLKKD